LKVRILRLPDAEAKTGLKRSAIYERISKGEFPTPVHLGTKARGWLEHELDAWIEAQAAKRRAGGGRGKENPRETAPGKKSRQRVITNEEHRPAARAE
jgi:prophage regulatory protein